MQQSHFVGKLAISVARRFLQRRLLLRLDFYHTPKQSPTNHLYLTWNRGNLRHPRVAFAQQHFLIQLKS
ncbi:MAG: hypothetical protein AAF921_16705 [Cyanobacteria bacterium P01_D01_bin.44]